MRKKLIKNTYLRDVEDFEIKYYQGNADFYASCKKIKKVKSAFVLNDGTHLIDDGYKIVEFVPKNENYAVRVFVDDKSKIVQYYFDITRQNGFDEEENSPFFDDLFVDILITNGKVRVVDENELEYALNSGAISKEDFDLALNVKNKLLSEIENGTNKFLNIDINNYL